MEKSRLEKPQRFVRKEEKTNYLNTFDLKIQDFFHSDESKKEK
jgi:hypothetical protein